MTEQTAERRGTRLIRLAQVLLVVGAAALWVASRLTWVVLRTSDGLGQPKTVTLTGAMWSTVLVPVAVLLAAASIAALAVRGWPLRALAVLLALVSAATAYLGISQWVVPDVAVRAADVADVPVASLVGSEREYGGALIAVCVAGATLVAAILLMRSASTGRAATSRYLAPGARRSAARGAAADTAPKSRSEAGEPMSERMMWDALDEGRDPTDPPPDSGAGPQSEGR